MTASLSSNGQRGLERGLPKCFTNLMFYKVLSFKALLSDVVRGNELEGVFYRTSKGLNMNETRNLMSHQLWEIPGKNNNFDTVLGLTLAKNFHNGWDDVDYGISVLGGACGDGARYKWLYFDTFINSKS